MLLEYARSLWSRLRSVRALRTLLACAVFACAAGSVWADAYCWRTAAAGKTASELNWSIYSNWKIQDPSNNWTWIDNDGTKYSISVPGDSSNTDATVYINTDDANGSIIVYVTADTTVQNLFIESDADRTVTIVLSEGVMLTVTGTLTLGNTSSNADVVQFTISGKGTVSATTITYKNTATTSTLAITDGATLTASNFYKTSTSSSIDVTGDGSGSISISNYTDATIAENIDKGSVSYADSTYYYITIHANGGVFGTGSSAKTEKTYSVKKTESLTLDDADSLVMGYSGTLTSGKAFLGWATAADVTTTTNEAYAYADGATFTPTASLILYAVWADVSVYYWRTDVTSGNWTESTNWSYTETAVVDAAGNFINNAEPEGTAVYYKVRAGYPGLSATDWAFIPASEATTVTLDDDITLERMQFGLSIYESDITFKTNAHTLSVSTMIMHNMYYSILSSTLTVSGGGELITKGFDSPNQTYDPNTQTEGHINTINIASGTTLSITGDGDVYWGNGNDDDPGYTYFTGEGTLNVVASGANVEWGTPAIRYDSSLNRQPVGKASDYYYSVAVDYSTLTDVLSTDATADGLSVTFSVTRMGDSAYPISFPFTASISDESARSEYMFAGEALPDDDSTFGSVIYTETGLGSGTLTEYLKSTSPTGDNAVVTLYIWTPDKSLILAEITSGEVWTGTVSTDWATAGNWSSGSVPTPDTSVRILTGAAHYPVISADGAVADSVYIAANASLTMTGGTLALSSLTTTSTGAFTASDGTLTFTGDDSGVASWSAEYPGVSTFANVSIADGCTLTANADMTISSALAILKIGTIDLAGNTITSTSFYLNRHGNVSSSEGSFSVAATLQSSTTSGGMLVCTDFNFPNAYQHTLTIDSGTTLRVTKFFAGEIAFTNYTSLTISGSGTLEMPASGACLHEQNGTKSFTIDSGITLKTYGEPTYYTVSALGASTGVAIHFTVDFTGYSGFTSGVTVPFKYWAEPVDENNAGKEPAIDDFTLGGTKLVSTATSASALASTGTSFYTNASAELILTYVGTTDLVSGTGGRLHIYTPDGLFELLVVEYVQDKSQSWTGEVSSSWTTSGNWACGYMPAFGSVEIGAVSDGCYTPVLTEDDYPAASITYDTITLTNELELIGGSLQAKTVALSGAASLDIDGGSLTADWVTTEDQAALSLFSGSATIGTLTLESDGVSGVDAGTLTVSDALSVSGGIFSVTDGTLDASDCDFILGSLGRFVVSGGSVTLKGLTASDYGEYTQSAGVVTVTGACSLTDAVFTIEDGLFSAVSFAAAGQSDVTFTGGTTTVSGALALSNSDGVTFNGGSVICASYTATSDVITEMSAGSLTMTGDFENEGSFSLGEALLTIGGNFTNLGTFEATGTETTSQNTCLVSFTGDAELTGSATFTHLAFMGENVTVTVHDTITVKGACAHTSDDITLTFEADNTFRIFLSVGNGANITFAGANTFEQMNGTRGGAYFYGAETTATFDATNTFDVFFVSGADCSFVFSDDNMFASLSLLGEGCTVKFGAGKTQTVTDAFACTGNEEARNTLTTDAASPMLSDENTWWILDMAESVGINATATYTDVSYSRSVNNIRHSWDESVCEAVEWSTANWFPHTFYWFGDADTSWNNPANWYQDSERITQSFDLLPVTEDAIVIANADVGNPLVLTEDLYATNVTITAGSTLDIVSYAVIATDFTNNGTIRLQGASGQVITSDNMVNGDDSTIVYYPAPDGASIAVFPWDGDNDWSNGAQYENLVFESGVTADSGAYDVLLEVAGSLTNQGTVTLASGTLTVGSSLINEGTFTLGTLTLSVGEGIVNTGALCLTGGSNSLSIPAYTGADDGSDSIEIAGGTLTFATAPVVGNITLTAGVTQIEATALSVVSSWTNQVGTDGFNANGVPVRFTGTSVAISGDTVFAELAFTSAGSAVSFAAGSTQTATRFVVTGTTDNPIVLQSDTAGSVWYIDTPATVEETSTVQHATISDSFSMQGTVLAANSTDAGNNTNWVFAEILAVWTGDAASSSWQTAANWSTNQVPLLGDVFIPSGLSYYPVITDSDGPDETALYAELVMKSASRLTMQGGTLPVQTLSIATGASLEATGGTLLVSADITNAGTLSASGGTVRFTGSAPQTLSLLEDGNAQFCNIEIADGAELSCAASVAVTGSLANNGSFTATGTVRFTGTAVTVSGTSTFATAEFPTADATITVSGSNTFGTLSLTGAGSTVRFGAGKTQTVTESFVSLGTEGKLITLTTDAASPSAFDTNSWWALSIDAELGQALGEDSVAYTAVEYALSENDITHEWAESVTEKTAGSTLRWFMRVYYWKGGTDSSWATSANWALTQDGATASVESPESNGSARIVIATATGGNTLVLEADIAVESLMVASGCTIDLAACSVTVSAGGLFTNNGTVRLAGGTQSAPQTIDASMVNGEESTIAYYGTSLSALLWDGDADTAGAQYANLVFESTAAGTIRTALTLSGSLSVEAGAAVVFASTVRFTGTAVTVSGTSTFTTAEFPTADASITVSGANTFGTLSLTGAGSTVRFGAGKTQTVTGAFKCVGAEGKPITLTTDAASPSALDTTDWWTLSIDAATGQALGEDSVAYTAVEYAVSVNDITHEWAESVTEKTAGSTLRWFMRTYYWKGGTDSSWNTSANWALTQDGATASVESPSASGKERIVIATAAGGNTLVLSADIAVGSLLVPGGYVLDLASSSVSVSEGGHFTNNGTVRLTGGSSDAPQTIDASMVNGEESTIAYYGASLSTLPWDADTDTAGSQYANLVFESTAAGTVSTALAVSGSLSMEAGADVVLDAAATVSGALTNDGTLSCTTKTLTVCGTYSGSGTFTASSGETRFLGTVNLADATFAANDGTVVFAANGEQELVAHEDWSTVFFNVEISSATALKTASPFVVAGNWTEQSGGSFEGREHSAVSFIGAQATITCTDNIADSRFTELMIGGEGIVVSGSLSAKECTVNADTSFTGSNQFESFTCEIAGGTLTFAAGTVQTVRRMFTIGGTEAKPVTLQSSVAGSPWTISVPRAEAANVYYATISDSTSTFDSISAYTSTDAGGNTNWLFISGLELPNIALMLAPIGSDKAYAIFEEKLAFKGVTFDELSSEQLQHALNAVGLDMQFMEQRVGGAGGQEPEAQDSGLMIESAEYIPGGDTYSVLLLTLNQTVTLEKLCSVTVYIKRVASEYKRHFHVLSDFALDLIEPQYAYADYATKGDTIEPGTELFTRRVRDFTADSTESLRSDADILLQTQCADSSVRAVFVADIASALNKLWQSNVVNAALGTSWRVWLPSYFAALASGANTNTLTERSGQAVSGSDSLWNYELPNESTDEDCIGWKGGDEVQFLFQLYGEDDEPIMLDSDGDGAGDIPLYALSVSAPVSGTFPTLDLWSFKIRDAVKQRGGVTILNNVIDVNAREQTVVQVDMPEAGSLNVYVLTADGNIVRRLEHGRVSSGTHYYSWNGTNGRGNPVARGIYFIRVSGGGIDETRKVMCVKE